MKQIVRVLGTAKRDVGVRAFRKFLESGDDVAMLVF